MSDTLSLAVAAVMAVSVVALLGLPIALGLRTRGFMIAVVTVPAAFASIALASITAPIIGLAWSLWPALILSLVLGAVLRLITRPRLTTTRERGVPMTGTPARNWVWPTLAAVFAVVITGHTLFQGIPAAGSVSQTYDAVFHLNAVKYILETGSASPFAMDLTTPGSATFYPTLWHAMTALIAQLSGASISVATNAMTLVTTSTTWSIGAIALGRAVAGSGRIATLSSGIAATLFPTFPLGLAAFGVLYPNLLALTLVPYVLVGLAQLCNIGPARTSDPATPLTRVLLTIGALGAAILAHPNAFHTCYLIVAGFVLARIITVITRRSSPAAWGKMLLLVAVFAGLGAGLWHIGRTTINPWGGSHGPFGALLEAFGTFLRFDGHNWLVFLLLVVGALITLRRTQLRPYLLAYVIVLGFYVIADGFPRNPLRELFLSPWYSDPWRLAAIVPIGMLPLVTLGLTSIFRALHPVITQTASRFAAPRALTRISTPTVLLVTGVALAATSLYPAAVYLGDRYGADPRSTRVLSTDEEALLDRLGNTVPEESLILVNPWNGGSLAYALADRKVSLPHMTGSYDERAWVAADGIARGTSEACNAAQELGAGFVLDFGDHFIFDQPGMRSELRGITGIQYAPALTTIDREGEAVLYEITGCDWEETQ